MLYQKNSSSWIYGEKLIFGKVLNNKYLDIVNTLDNGDKIIEVSILQVGDKAKEFVKEEATIKKLNKAVEEEKRKLAAEEERKRLIEHIRDAVEQKVTEFQSKYLGAYSESNYIPTTVVAFVTPGAGPYIRNGYQVSINYTLKKPDGTVIKSSAKTPYSFILGNKIDIPYFNEIVQHMRLGQKRHIIINPDKLYGRTISTPTHPDTWLELDIELLSAKFKIEKVFNKDSKLNSIAAELFSHFTVDYISDYTPSDAPDDYTEVTLNENNHYISIELLESDEWDEESKIVEELLYLGNNRYLNIYKYYPSKPYKQVSLSADIYIEKNGYLHLQKDFSDVPINIDLLVSEEEIVKLDSDLLQEVEGKYSLIDYIVDPENKEISISFLPVYSDFPEDLTELVSEIKSRKFNFKWDSQSSLFLLK